MDFKLNICFDGTNTNEYDELEELSSLAFPFHFVPSDTENFDG